MGDDERAWLRAQFERCAPWLQAALDRDVGTHALEDVWALIESGIAQLWPTPDGAMVTVVETYPKAKVLRGWLAGGDLRQIQKSEPTIRAWAKDVGCTLVMIGGRRGWLKAFDGYREFYTVMVREI